MPTLNAKCPFCGAVQTVDGSKDASICGKCGRAFVVEQAVQNYYSMANHSPGGATDANGNFCVRCGTRNSQYSRFCSKCGAKMVGAAPAAPMYDSGFSGSRPAKSFSFVPIIVISLVIIAVILTITFLKPAVQRNMDISRVRNGKLYKYDFGVSIGDALHEWFNGTEEWNAYDENGVRKVTARGTTRYTLSGEKEMEVFIFQISGDQFLFVGAFDSSGNYIASASGNDFADIGINLYNAILGVVGTDFYDLYCQAAFGNREILNSLKGEENLPNETTEADSFDWNATDDYADTPDVNTNERTQADYDELMDSIMMYYVVNYGTNNVDAEIDGETEDSVIFRLFDPYANTTSNTLGFYEYNWDSGLWKDSITGQILDL